MNVMKKMREQFFGSLHITAKYRHHICDFIYLTWRSQRYLALEMKSSVKFMIWIRALVSTQLSYMYSTAESWI